MSVHNPLTASAIQRKVSCNFLLYENMHKIRNINDFLPRTLILYQLAHVGHFCCIFKNNEGIQFFDPMGDFPDDELKNSMGYAPNHGFAYLDNLLMNSPLPVIYNQYKLQGHGTATCGHWCTTRMIFDSLYCDEFAECFKGVKNRDEIVVKLFNSF